MSRTVRRKNEKWDYPYCNSWNTYVILRGWYTKEEINKCQIMYHTDAQNTMAQSPAWFRRHMNRQKRARQSAELIKCLQSNEYEYVPNLKEFKNVLWNWW